MSKDHRAIIAHLGGIRPLVRELGHTNHTTVQGWWERNRIPDERLAEVLSLAASKAAVAQAAA